MGNLKVDLGLVQYDSDSMLSPVPLAAQIGLGAGAAAIILMVLVVILMYRCVPVLWSLGEPVLQILGIRGVQSVSIRNKQRRESALQDRG